ncbi:protein ABHD18 isoform X2 [Venturia canescens]|uniref:protein ABHD18 isoform X2 n=1 Tax=Venturia canescens TaxID=32260 RepID=UPI001C9BE455|nr:protein ABHD18 isoform X2 [Venturia canescens]
MAPSRLDAVYRSILLTKFFTKGWGNPDSLRRIFEFRKIVANREACYNLIPRDYPINITKDEEWSDCHIVEGCFESPFEHNLPNIMPEETKTCYFQLILPLHWSSQKIKPVCLHLAGTGDHEAGIASLLLENPFYGMRKPKDQIRSNLHNVADIFIMGGCLIMESIVLLNWCEQRGFGPLGLTGLSMGGHMASLAATNWPKPIALVPCLSWSTASPVFTQGVMSTSINWQLLESQYFSNEVYQNDLAKMVKIIDQDDAFLAGQHFVKHYPASLKRMNEAREQSHNPEVDKSMEVGKVDEVGIENNNNMNARVDEERVAAKMFPLNLIYERFKSNEPDKLEEVCMLPASKDPLRLDSKYREREAFQFMRGVMDECTHLRNFEVPVDTSLIIAICAKDDAYVPREGCMSLEEIWPGAEIRYIDAGHVTGYLLHQKFFRSMIAEAFGRSLKKYPIDERS